uniref:Uncharacterized protein n=1 Tax=Mucochytrium quahogii TaxID=96639 RepID=A0A7S2S065_9STRA|mmetsp:Transcript_12377/g.22438  ORF Transcript_12377/g.22438 Transcript_12377/m.22438 type:complete len:436 (+) Transcript_12377:148-1455(+)
MNDRINMSTLEEKIRQAHALEFDLLNEDDDMNNASVGSGRRMQTHDSYGDEYEGQFHYNSDEADNIRQNGSISKIWLDRSQSPSMLTSLSTPPSRRSKGVGSGEVVPFSPNAGDISQANSTLLSPDIDRNQNCTPAESALRKLVLELREVKLDRDRLVKLNETAKEEAIAATKRTMDEDFRLVVKAMIDEKVRAVQKTELRVRELEDQHRLDQDRLGMALAEIESIKARRRRPFSPGRSAPGRISSTKLSMIPSLRDVPPAPPSQLKEKESSGKSFVFVEEDDSVKKPMNTPSAVEDKGAKLKRDDPAKVIFDALVETLSSVDRQSSGGGVPVGKVRTFLRQSELLPPTMLPADLDIILSKHSKRRAYVSLADFSNVLADIALELLACGILTVPVEDEGGQVEGEKWEWGVRSPKTQITRAAAVRALGQVLFPDE